MSGIYLGGNLAKTSYGKDLPDGGFCALKDGRIEFAIAEERLTGTKTEGGFNASMAFYSARFGSSRIKAANALAVSTCCDFLGRAKHNIEVINSSRVIYCPHHLSHALGSFAWSGLSEAVVIVMDSGGDTLEEVRGGQWWRSSREQHSAFFVNRTGWRLIERNAAEADAIGFGEFFRAVTYFLGWGGARFAGNTMALASLGEARRLRLTDFFTVGSKEGEYAFPAGNDPRTPVELVIRHLAKSDARSLMPRGKGDPFSRGHFDLAAWLQSELDRYILHFVDRLTKICATKNVILSGGVAYNCVGIGRLHYLRPGLRIFVQPASGDAGQCVGNACFAFLQHEGQTPNFAGHSASLGRAGYKNRPPRHKSSSFETVYDNRFQTAAAWLAAGNILLFFHGGSEYGPRALGYRSILAAPHLAGAKAKLNRIKFRNYLMPVAPAILDEERERIFDCESEKPFMTECVALRAEFYDELPTCQHGSGRSRIQTVDKTRNKDFWELLKVFYSHTGYPLLLNTSLNGPGQPIIETPQQAIEFLEILSTHGIVAAWINGKFFRPLKIIANPKLNDDPSSYAEYIDEIAFDHQDFLARLTIVFPDIDISKRDRFLLNEQFIEWVREGRKTTTVRYRKGAIECPTAARLPLFATKKFEGFSEDETPLVDAAILRRIDYKAFGDLDEADARNDGFQNLLELRSTLLKIYSKIDDFELVTIFTITLRDDAAPDPERSAVDPSH